MRSDKVKTPSDPKTVLGARLASLAQDANSAFHSGAEHHIRAGVNPVRAWRTQYGWSVKKLARAIRVDDDVLCKIERNLWYAYASEFHLIARAFGIHPADLVAAHDAMPYDLRSVLVTAALVDGGRGRTYGARAMDALRQECVKAQEVLEAELATLAKTDDDFLSYTLVKRLRDAARAGPMDYDDAQDIYDAVRDEALDSRDAVKARRKSGEKQFDAYVDEFSDLAYATRGCRNAGFERDMHMLDQWQRIFGRRDLLTRMRENPAFFGFKPWHHAQPKQMVNRRLMTWEQAYERFLHISGQALSINECDAADLSEIKRLDTAIDRLETWWEGEHETTLVYRLTNLATIAHAVPQVAPARRVCVKADLVPLLTPKVAG